MLLLWSWPMLGGVYLVRVPGGFGAKELPRDSFWRRCCRGCYFWGLSFFVLSLFFCLSV